MVLACVEHALAQLSNYVPANDLLAWYNMDGSPIDASGNGHHGGAFNTTTTTDRTGQQGGAYFFNGFTSEISIPYTSELNAYPFSVSLWCLLADDDNGGMLAQHYSNSSWNGWVMSTSGTGTAQQTVSPGYMLAAPPNCNGVVSSAECATGINYSGNLYDSQWHMLTFTIDGDSGRFYLDGLWQTSQAWTGPAGAPTNTDNLRIGGTDLGDVFFFHGSIDEVGIWNRALDAAEITLLYNGLPPTEGCMNSNACNYSASATTDDGSCVFDCAGCIDPCACNYNQNAAYNDGSCDYSCNVAMTAITVFHDANGNGVFDNNERPMQYWPVQIVELEKMVYTDAAGTIVVPITAGAMHYELINTTDNWASTTPTQVELIVPGNTQAFFGLQTIDNESSVDAEELAGYYSYVHCEQGLESGMYVRNTGGQVLHGTLVLTCDPQYIPNNTYSLSTGPSTAGSGFAQWNIENLQPWETRLLAFHVDGPGADWLGQFLSYTLQLDLLDESGTLVYTNSIVSNKEVSCEQETLRMQTDPAGFNELYHYVTDGSQMTFRVQLHNTSAEWAEDALIIQNLNSHQFDLTSFELVYASEEVVGCLHDDGTIDLEFSNIMLAPPDADPLQSGAYAVYRTRLHDNLTPDSTFYHNAHLVFDMNNTAAADTVYHTIYDCSRLASIVGDSEYCEGDTVFIEAGEPWIDNYRWLIGDSLIGNEQQLRTQLDAGSYTIVSEFTNPVCTTSTHTTIEVYDAPEGELMYANDTLFSIGEYVCLWFLNESLVEGATQHYLPILTDGVYRVLWTSASGCEAWSEAVLVNNISGTHTSDWKLFPNPADTYTEAIVPDPGDIEVSDMSGRIVFGKSVAPGINTIDCASYAPGVYQVRLLTSGGMSSRLLIVH